MDRARILMANEIEIAKLKKDIEQVNNINSRIDTAIDKLTDVSTSIKSMLAVHSEKIARQEQVDEIIFEKLKDTGYFEDKTEPVADITTS